MQFLVCVAGLPKVVVDEIHALPAARLTEDRNNAVIARPLTKPPFEYRDGMSDAYLQAIAERIASMPATAEAALVLLYVGYPGRGTERFLSNFFPFALTGAINPFDLDGIPKQQRRHELNKYMKELEKRLAALRDRCS